MGRGDNGGGEVGGSEVELWEEGWGTREKREKRKKTDLKLGFKSG